MSVKPIVVMALVVCFWAVGAVAAPVLTSYDAKSFTLSVPKSWTVVADASKGMVVSQQDPKRKDAAQLLVIVSSGGTTDDQVLEMMLKSIASPKVVKRESLPNGAGKVLVADGTTDGIKVRLGAIAASNSSGVIVGMLISKVDEFDALGGTATVGAVLASIKLSGATTTEPAPSSGTNEVMTPTYDAYKNLIVPPPQRAITQADLAGEWKNTGKSLKGYVNTSTGGYAGYRFGDGDWESKPFVSVTIKAGRVGAVELWLQHLPGNRSTVQVRYAKTFHQTP